MVALLYTNNDLSEREIKKKEKKTISFTIASKRIQYLRINLTKEVKDLYSENYKTLMKETEDKTNSKQANVSGREYEELSFTHALF